MPGSSKNGQTMSDPKSSRRKLPLLILGEGNDPQNWEAKAVLNKYRSDDAKIGEENIDFVAIGYMNMQAIAYWIPRFFDYLRNQAPTDSFHFESMLFKLANNIWVHDFRNEASDAEVAVVRDYLAWFGKHPMMINTIDLDAAAYAYAVQLWK
jgi:hypothetical protein